MLSVGTLKGTNTKRSCCEAANWPVAVNSGEPRPQVAGGAAEAVPAGTAKRRPTAIAKALLLIEGECRVTRHGLRCGTGGIRAGDPFQPARRAGDGGGRRR